MPPADTPRNYIPSLDGIRALAVGLVFFSHAGVSSLIPGGFGVTVFFFLSGYLITTLLIREYEQYRSVSIRAFYLRRLVRLGPSLLVTLGLSALLVALGLAEGNMDLGAFFSQIFFYYNYYSLASQGNPASSVDGLSILWSLSVEEHFYLIYPLVFSLIFVRRSVLRTISVVLLAILCWRYFRVLALGHDGWSIYISTDTRFDSILYGCLLAVMTAKRVADRLFRKDWMFPFLLFSGGLLLCSFLFRDELFRATIRYSIQGLALLPVFYFAISYPDHWLFKPLNWKPVRRIGQYSYTLYLAHFVIVKSLIYNEIFLDQAVLFVGLAATLSVFYAMLVFEFLEKPLKPLRQTLTGH